VQWLPFPVSIQTILKQSLPALLTNRLSGIVLFPAFVLVLLLLPLHFQKHGDKGCGEFSNPEAEASIHACLET
jgi:hypothetical protein